MLKTGTIYGINGPVIYLKGNTGFRMSEMVYVGEEKLVGEVIALDKDLTTVQVYEETHGTASRRDRHSQRERCFRDTGARHPQ